MFARNKVVITQVAPQVEGGRFACKRIIGDEVEVQADVFTDGHDHIAVSLLFRKETEQAWQEKEMQHLGNDRWMAAFCADSLGVYYYTIHAWVNAFETWLDDVQKKAQAGVDCGQDIAAVKLMIRQALDHAKDARLQKKYEPLLQCPTEAELLAFLADNELKGLMRNSYPNKQHVTVYDKELSVIVEPRLAQFSTWYELFPRSCSSLKGAHGTLKDCIEWVRDIAGMGFDVLYLPPIHPIGTSNRKGKNNQLDVKSDDPGSPWAIGAKEGGHKAIHPQLGDFTDFRDLVEKAKKHGVHIAMDIAFQCSPDHPYITEHPEWFLHRPDGTIKHAENPPKKYEDIVPFNFETDHYKELWQELASIVFFWIEKGVTCFRVDNPHTKPFLFWQWLITEVKAKHPEVIFLSEAFTRPKVMDRLAKLGFSQSYTYFTWRYTKHELARYVLDVTSAEKAEYFRPNFWPNTPDILPVDLQYDGQATFMTRLILASTLSSNYGLYGPPYERMQNDAIKDTEEYADAEKYEVKHWDKSEQLPLKELMTKINFIRRKNPALQKTNNLKFYEISNSKLLCYAKFASESLLIVVCMDPYEVQSGIVKIPMDELGLPKEQSYRVHELLQDRRLIWEGDEMQVTIDPKILPARIFKIQTPIRREKGFEYFM